MCGQVSCSCEVKQQVPAENWLHYIYGFSQQEKSDLPKSLIFFFELSETLHYPLIWSCQKIIIIIFNIFFVYEHT